jgi:hypothetical protein
MASRLILTDSNRQPKVSGPATWVGAALASILLYLDVDVAQSWSWISRSGATHPSCLTRCNPLLNHAVPPPRWPAVADENALEQAVEKLLRDRTALRSLVENAEQVLMSHRGASERTAALVAGLRSTVRRFNASTIAP